MIRISLVVAQILAAIAVQAGKPILLVIGHPTGQSWIVPQHPAYDVKVIDRDLQPRTADAYTRFAALFGVVGDPLFVIVTPHMEPIAASSSTQFLDRIGRPIARSSWPKRDWP